MGKALRAGTGALVVLAALAGISPSSSKSAEAYRAMALAQLYAEKCKSLRVDWIRMAVFLEENGVSTDKLETPDGMKQLLAQLSDQARRLDGKTGAEICRMALADFGPKGRVRPDLLSDGMGAAAQNKLFDWLRRNGF